MLAPCITLVPSAVLLRVMVPLGGINNHYIPAQGRRLISPHRSSDPSKLSPIVLMKNRLV